MELKNENIVIDREIIFDEKGINVYLETWFDVEEKFGISLDEDESLDLYAFYLPDSDKLEMNYIIKSDSKNTEHNYIPTENEKDLIIKLIDERVKKNYGNSMLDEWEEFKSEYGEDICEFTQDF